MAELARATVLGGYDQTIDGLRLRERPEFALVSIALPRGREAEARRMIDTAFGLDLPGPGRSASNETHRLIWMDPDQMMLMFEDDAPLAEPEVKGMLEGFCYTTNQTDGWVILSLAGSRVREALSRLCPIDLHEGVFPVGAVARTVMEYMGAVVLRDGRNSFLLLSASSSAGSFLTAVEDSIRFTT